MLSRSLARSADIMRTQWGGRPGERGVVLTTHYRWEDAVQAASGWPWRSPVGLIRRVKLDVINCCCMVPLPPTHHVHHRRHHSFIHSTPPGVTHCPSGQRTLAWARCNTVRACSYTASSWPQTTWRRPHTHTHVADLPTDHTVAATYTHDKLHDKVTGHRSAAGCTNNH